jgi:DNA-binding MarR family transcriptional regulator
LLKEEILELQLMEELARANGMATQRELAKKLGISLGLVNAFVKRIVRKGYFKATTIPRRRIRYLLTPKGFVEKSRLTANYLRYSISYYRWVRTRLQAVAADLLASGAHRVVLVGTGELAELCYLTMQESGMELALFTSVNGATKRFLGYPVWPIEALEGKAFDVVCVMDLENAEQAMARLDALGIGKERVIVGTII